MPLVAVMHVSSLSLWLRRTKRVRSARIMMAAAFTWEGDHEQAHARPTTSSLHHFVTSTMATYHPSITDEQAELIRNADLFFVASADPQLTDGPDVGPVNVSPKGGVALHILGP